jgi:predicted component of type VI protein secretion system
MKLSLVVMTEGKGAGKTIPISSSQFIIGRDPQCQLRPASALISKRHCALVCRDGKYFVRDFDSTKGTFVNDEPVKGQRELLGDDTLKVGPLTFQVKIESSPVPVDKQTPLPKSAVSKSTSSDEDDSVSAMLLDLADDTSEQTHLSDAVPEGSTISEALAPDLNAGASGDTKTEVVAGKTPKAPDKKKDANSGDTSAAAQAILQKYMRRQRS